MFETTWLGNPVLRPTDVEHPYMRSNDAVFPVVIDFREELDQLTNDLFWRPQAGALPKTLEQMPILPKPAPGGGRPPWHESSTPRRCACPDIIRVYISAMADDVQRSTASEIHHKPWASIFLPLDIADVDTLRSYSAKIQELRHVTQVSLEALSWSTGTKRTLIARRRSVVLPMSPQNGSPT
jgi:hypothetical protein